jgi:hypothetical protein
MSDANPDADSFLDALAHELRLRGVPVLRSELRTWVADCWSLIAEDPSPGRWAVAWLERRPARAE